MDDKTLTHWLDTLENTTDDNLRIKAIQVLYNFRNSESTTISLAVTPLITADNETVAQSAIRAIPRYVNYQEVEKWHNNVVPIALEQYSTLIANQQHSEETQLLAVEHIAKLSTPNDTPAEVEGNIRIINTLLDLLVDSNPNIRAKAINKLYGLKRYGNPIVPRLSTALYDADPIVRQEALNLIPYLRSFERGIQQRELLVPLEEKVLDLLESEVSRELRVLALRAYQSTVGNERLTKNDADYVKEVALEGLLPLNLPPSVVNVLQFTCCDILRQFPEQQVAEKLQAFISSPHAISRARERATNVLQRMSVTKQSLAQRLSSATPDARLRIIQSMKGSLPTGEEVDALLPYLNDPNPQIRESAATALASSRETYRTSQPLIDAVVSGRVPLKAIARTLADQGNRAITSMILSQLRNGPEHLRVAAEKDWAHTEEYIERMSRLY